LFQKVSTVLSKPVSKLGQGRTKKKYNLSAF
jgi:hypothetical protein